MKAANQLVAEVLAELRESVRAGRDDRRAGRAGRGSRIRAGGGEPAFKGYHGFPATICASVNEEVIHGIPSQRELVEGDIISIDLGAVLDGFYGDSAVTVPVGRVSERGGGAAAGDRGVAAPGDRAACGWARGSRISARPCRRTSSAHGFSVVREFVGHGIGQPAARGAADPELRAGRARVRGWPRGWCWRSSRW